MSPPRRLRRPRWPRLDVLSIVLAPLGVSVIVAAHLLDGATMGALLQGPSALVVFGGTLGAKLALAGHQVALLARGPNLNVLATEGLRLVDHVDDLTGRLRLPASDRPADLGPQDLVVVSLKSHQIAEVVDGLKQGERSGVKL